MPGKTNAISEIEQTIIPGFSTEEYGSSSLISTAEKQTYIANFKEALTTLQNQGVKIYKTNITINGSNLVLDYVETTGADFPIAYSENDHFMYFGIDESIISNNDSLYVGIRQLLRGFQYPTFKLVGKATTPIYTKQLWKSSTGTDEVSLYIFFGDTFTQSTITASPTPCLSVTKSD